MQGKLSLFIALAAAVWTPLPSVTAEAAGARTPATELSSALEAIKTLRDESRYEEAEARARELLAEVETASGPDSLEAAEVLNELVSVLREGGKSSAAETLELAERALEIRRELLEPDNPKIAASLWNKANVLSARAELDEAAELMGRALEIYRESLGPESTEARDLHGNLGVIYYRAGNYGRARAEQESALAITERLDGPESVEAAYYLRALANALAMQGETARAEDLYRRALAIQEAELGPEHEQVGNTLNNLGLHLLNAGDLEAARSYLERAVEVKETALGPDHPNVGYSVGNLTILHDQLGNVREAERGYERFISIFEDAVGPDHPLTARGYGNYGTFLTGKSDYVGARESYERALAIFEKTLGPNHPDTTWMVLSMGLVMTHLGSYDEAQGYFDRALRFWEEFPDPAGDMKGHTLEQAGRLALARGDLATARERLEGARIEFGELYGERSLRAAGAESALGEVLLASGALVEADATLAHALEIRLEVLGDGHPEVAEILNHLGEVKEAAGDCPAALELYRRAAGIMEGSPLLPDLAAEIQLGIARCLAGEGEFPEAVGAALEAEGLARQHLRLMLAGLEERVGLKYAASRESGLDLALSLLAAHPELGLAEEGFDALVRSRALVLDELAGRLRAFRSREGGAADLAEALAAARERLAFLTVRGPTDPEDLESYDLLMRRALEERDLAERRLAERSRSFRRLQRARGAGFAEVRDALPEGAGLVSFARIEPRASSGEASYVAMVATRDDRQPRVVSLGPSDEIEQAIARLRAAIAEEEVEGDVGGRLAEMRFRDLAAGLRQRVWDPIAPNVQDLERLFLVPDGDLHLVSLAALPVGESDYLIERGPRLHYLSAERDLLSLTDAERGTGLLALGDPDFEAPELFASLAPAGESVVAALPETEAEGRRLYRGSRSACADFDAMRFEALPATEAEIGDVVASWEQGAAGDRSSLDRLLGSGASETAVKLRSAGRRALHLATHGFFLGEECPSPPGGSRGGREPPEPKWTEIESPLLQAGLALAGANNRSAAGPGEDDGILTAEEIAALDLEGVDWAVLSACESGLGEIRAGEGVLGLRRAFRMAGARTLVMSLWRVEDEPTREWMRRLYERRFVDGLPTIDAVHRATLDLLAARRAAGQSTHPYYWAGFVAAGDWR